MSKPPFGTANVLHQITAYEDLKEEYSAETANELTAKSLNRHGIEANSGDVASWSKINNAAVDGNLDIPSERSLAETHADNHTKIIISSAGRGSEFEVVNTFDESNEDCEDDEISSDEGLRSSIDDLYGYDDPEDNAEAALDDVLKAQERCDT